MVGPGKQVFARILKFILPLLLAFFASEGTALHVRTEADLRALQDRLEYEFPESQRSEIAPLLISSPQPYWEESRTDFSPSVFEILQRVFSHSGDLIPCSECFKDRVYVAHDQRMVVDSGELTIHELANLRQNPAYREAKSLVVVRETPSGLDTRVVALDDGRILFTGLVDAQTNLDKVERPMHLARELDRRKRGEALSYVNFDLGVFPQLTVQLKFLEQWGSHNQHLSGFVISAYNPTGAVGATYMYMLPFRRRFVLGTNVLYTLGPANESSSDGDKGGKGLVLQGTAHYALNGSFGFFATIGSSGVFSVGVSLLNPVLFPFLL